MNGDPGDGNKHYLSGPKTDPDTGERRVQGAGRYLGLIDECCERPPPEYW